MSNTLRDNLALALQPLIAKPINWTPNVGQILADQAADAVLKAIADSGCVIVPLEPSESDIDRFLVACDIENHCCGCKPDSYTIHKWGDGLRAMIAASQEAQG